MYDPTVRECSLTDDLGIDRDLAVQDPATGNTSAARHGVYGAHGNANAAVGCPFGLTGISVEEDSGMQNNLNRWYDAKVGRWLEEDPLGLEASDANLERYVGNQVTSATDPTGLQFLRHPEFGPSDRDTAIADIQANRGTYVAKAAAQFLLMLRAAPPKGDGIPNLSDADLGNVALALAQVYVDAVLFLLKEWPGAELSNGFDSSFMIDRALGDRFDSARRNEEDVAAGPVCSDWCEGLIWRMRLGMAGYAGKYGPLKTADGVEYLLSKVVYILWAQKYDGSEAEHNYPIVIAEGQMYHPPGQVDILARPTYYCILDAWATLRPTVASPDTYRMDALLDAVQTTQVRKMKQQREAARSKFPPNAPGDIRH